MEEAPKPSEGEALVQASIEASNENRDLFDGRFVPRGLPSPSGKLEKPKTSVRRKRSSYGSDWAALGKAADRRASQG